MAPQPEAGAAGAARAIELLGSQDELVRVNAARALGAWKARAAVGPLIEALRDPSRDVQRHAVVALGAIGRKDAVPALLRLLADGGKELRLSVVHALEKTADPRAVEPLVPLLATDYPLSEAAGKALRAIGKPAVPALLGTLSHEDWKARRDACIVLGQIADKESVPALAKLLRDPNYAVRATAADALRRIGDLRAADPLLAAMCAEERDYSGSQHALARLLREREEARLEPVARAFLEDKDAGVRAEARRTLARLRTPLPDAWRDELVGVAHEIARQLGDVRALAVLEDLGHRAQDALFEVLKTGSPYARVAAAEGLRKAGDARAIGPLLESLKLEHAWLRREATKTINIISDRLRDQAVPALARYSNAGETALIRATAAQALRWTIHRESRKGVEPLLARWTGGEQAVAALLKALDDPDDRVRMAAADTLRRVPDARALAPLMAHLGDRSDYARERIVGAVKAVAGPDAPALFIKALSHADEAIRKEALGQLRRMGSWEDRLDCGADPAKWRQWLEKRRRAQKAKDRAR